MSPYRAPDTGADALPHCLGLAYVGTRTLGFEERSYLRRRTNERLVRMVWKVVAMAVLGPTASLAVMLVAARFTSSLVVIAAASFGFVGVVLSWVLAIERARTLLPLKRDQRAGEVLRFEGVLPEDAHEQRGARELAEYGLLKAGVATSVEVFPRSALVWRAHDTIVDAPIQLEVAVRNISARRT